MARAVGGDSACMVREPVDGGWSLRASFSLWRRGPPLALSLFRERAVSVRDDGRFLSLQLTMEWKIGAFWVVSAIKQLESWRESYPGLFLPAG